MEIPDMKNFLFGAGHYALPMKWYLEDQGVNFHGVILTNKTITSFDGVDVYKPEEITYAPKSCRVFFAVSKKYHFEVEHMLKGYGFLHFVKYTDEELENHYCEANNLKKMLLEKYNDFLPSKNDCVKSWSKILIIRLDGIGDMVLFTPLIREIKRTYGNSEITLITNKITNNLFEKSPYIDELVSIDWQKEIFNSPFVVQQLRNARQFMVKNFSSVQFDVAIVPRYDCDYYGASFLSLFSGAPYRIAFSEHVHSIKEKMNKDFDLMFSKIVNTSDVCHEVERCFQILRALDINYSNESLELWADPCDNEVVKRIIEKIYKHGKKDIIVFGLAANLLGRVWSKDAYVSLARGINGLNNEKYVFVLLGGEQELGRAKYIERKLGVENIVNLCNKISLRQVYALLRYCKIYIGHDTGIMHIAAAAEIPIVEICATPLNAPLNHSSSTIRFCPWQVKCEILRPSYGYWDDGWRNPNGTFAINDISVDRVFAAVVRMLKESI